MTLCKTSFYIIDHQPCPNGQLSGAFIEVIRYVHLASVFNVISIFFLWYLIGLKSWLIYFFVLCIYSIILSYNFFGGYNHGPCGGEVGFVTLCLLL